MIRQEAIEEPSQNYIDRRLEQIYFDQIVFTDNFWSSISTEKKEMTVGHF
jgi:hypothetical protein